MIFATDVAGYSKHMEGTSETILNLRECEAILTGLFSKYEDAFNTGGDYFSLNSPVQYRPLSVR